MTSTESKTVATVTTISTSGSSSQQLTNVEDIKDENVLREMWQGMEDGDAKRQVRSRMYKLREERLKDYYGREGQDILESILKQPLDTEGMEQVQEERRVVTTTQTSSFREGTGEPEVVKQQQQQSRVVTAKQTKVLGQEGGGNVVVTTTTTTTCGGSGGGGGDAATTTTRTTKQRIVNKDRGAQLEEVRRQQQSSSSSSSRRNVETSGRALSKRSSVESDSSVTKGGRGGSGRSNMTNGVVSKRKQTTTTTVTTTGGGGGASGGKQTTTRTSTTTVSTDDNKEAGNEDNNSVLTRMVRVEENEDAGGVAEEQTRKSESRVASLSRNFIEQPTQQQQRGSSMTRSTVMSQSSVMMTASSFGTTVGGTGNTVQTTKVVKTVISSQGAGGTGQQQETVTYEQFGNEAGNEPQTAAGGKLEVGRVVIKEMSGANNETTSSSGKRERNTTTGSSNKPPSRQTSRQSSSVSKRESANLITNGASSENRTRSSVTTTISNKASSENNSTVRKSNKTDRSNVTVSSNKSSNRAPPQQSQPPVVVAQEKKDGSFSASVEAQEKLCRRSQHKLSRESSPKGRSCSRRPVSSEDNASQQQTTTTTTKQGGSPTRKTQVVTTATSRTGTRQSSPSKDTVPTGARTVVAKKEEEKTSKITEEKIMRELDILDTFLSQRSQSIDESNPAVAASRGEENSATVTRTSTTNTAAATRINGEERRVRKSDKATLGKANKEEVDVMESGLEPPFTRTVYKRTCPDDHHDHPDHRARKRDEPKKQQSPEKSRPGVRRDGKAGDVVELEEEIVVDAAETSTATTTATRRGDRTASRSRTSQKTTGMVVGKQDKPQREPTAGTASKPGKRPVSQSPEKPRKSSGQPESSSRGRKPATTTGADSKAVEEAVTSATAHVTTSAASATQERRSKVTGEKLAMSDVDKYEADILSRPSVFTARKATTAGKSTTTTSTSTSTARKPSPNPRLRKSSDSSPEREVVRGSSYVPREATSEVTEEDDNVSLASSKKFAATREQLESPGAVLKAKSLFETKATEAAKDRSSIELGSKVTTSPKLTVSKKAALFEARCRGERISISSDEEQGEEEDEGGVVPQRENGTGAEHGYKTSRVPEANERAFSMERSERRVSQVVNLVKRESEMSMESGEEEAQVSETTRKSISRKDSEKSSTVTRATTGRTSATRDLPDRRELSPEKNERVGSPAANSSPRRKSSATTSTRTSNNLERPIQQNRRASEATSYQLSKATNGIAPNMIRTVHRTVIEENINNNQRRGSIGILTTVDKRNSLANVEKLPIEAPIDLIDLRRKDSRGISLASSKIIIQNQEQRKTLQDIEQKLSSDRIVIRDHRDDESPEREESPSPKRSLSRSPSPPRRELRNSQKTAEISGELKSTNVVKQATLRHQQQQQQQQQQKSEQVVVERQQEEVSSAVGNNIESKPPRGRNSSPQGTTGRRTSSQSPERLKSPTRARVAAAAAAESTVSTSTATTTTSSTTTGERRRSSKVEAIVQSLKSSSGTGSSSVTTSTTTSSSASNRMSTAELNAVDQMDSIEDLEKLLDRATDYDERSKIRARIRYLKRKATLVKRASDYNGLPATATENGTDKPKAASPPRTQTTGATTTSTTTTGSSTTANATSIERRTSRETRENKVTSRKSSSTDLAAKKEKETKKPEEVQQPARGTSPRKSPERQQSPPNSTTTTTTSSAVTQRKSVDRTGSSQRLQSRSNSGRVVTAEKVNENEEKMRTTKITSSAVHVESAISESIAGAATTETKTESTDQRQGMEVKRKLSTETSELLSTRNYSRDRNERRSEDKQITKISSVSSSGGTKAVMQDQELYSSRRNSKNLEDEIGGVVVMEGNGKYNNGRSDEVRKGKKKSRSPSPTITRRRRLKQTEEEGEEEVKQVNMAVEQAEVVDKEGESRESGGSGSASPRSKPGSRASSPQRSEIPISARMKRERSLSPPRKIIASGGVTERSEEQEKIETVEQAVVETKESKEIEQELQQQQIKERVEDVKECLKDSETTEVTTVAATNTTASAASTRKISSRTSSSSGLVVEEKTRKVSSSSASQRRAEAEKYEADILSRPSVFTARRAVEATKPETSTTTTTSTRTRRKSPSPERESSKPGGGSTLQTRGNTTTTTTTSAAGQRATSAINRTDSNRSLGRGTASEETSSTTTTQRNRQSTEEKSGVSSRSNAYSRKSNSKELIRKPSKGPEDAPVTDKETNARHEPSPRDKTIEESSQVTAKTDTSSIAEDTSSSTTTQATTVIKSVNTEVKTSTGTVAEDKVKTSKFSSRSSPPPTEVKVNGRSGTGGISSSTTTTTTRRTTTGSSFVTPQKTSTPPAKKVTERAESTDIVTSSYGIGPVDDDGRPLFGLRALRKIKQVQEQMDASSTEQESSNQTGSETRETSSVTSTVKSSGAVPEDSTPSPAAPAPAPTVVTSKLQSLRTNDMYGLRALRKQAQECNRDGSDNEQFPASNKSTPVSTRESSVEKDRRSTTTSSTRTVTTTSTLSTVSSSTGQEQEQEDGLNRKQSSEEEQDEEIMQTLPSSQFSSTYSSSTTTTGNGSEQRKSSSPKSILKKTSSFTSNATSSSSGGSSSTRKGSREERQSSAEPIPEGDSTGAGGTTARSSTTSSTTASSSARSSVERKISGKVISQDDESWRRQRSHSPSPKPAGTSSTTSSSVSTFSRSKVGRSSVREMSKKFESDTDTDQDTGNGQQTGPGSREGSPAISSSTVTTVSRTTRAESPSRIPLSIKSSTTVTSSTSSTSRGGQEDMTMETINNDGYSDTNTRSGIRGATTTVESFHSTGGPIICRNEETGDQLTFQGSQQQKVSRQQFGSADGSMSGTVVQSSRRTVTTTTTSTSGSGLGRSFLNDQSPIQNLEDVITRMRGEDPELMRPFVEEQHEDGSTTVTRVITQTGGGAGGTSTTTTTTSGSNEGRNLLNKFIGAQVIMQAMEPMLIAQQKVSIMSLEQNGNNGSSVAAAPASSTTAPAEPEPAKEMEEQVVVSKDNGKVEKENVSEMLDNCQIEEVVEESSSSSSSAQRQSRDVASSGCVEISEESSTQLTTQDTGNLTASEKSSLPAGETSSSTTTATSSSVASAPADVTGELMPFILGQLQSSLDSFTNSASAASTLLNSASSSGNSNNFLGDGVGSGGGGAYFGKTASSSSSTASCSSANLKTTGDGGSSRKYLYNSDCSIIPHTTPSSYIVSSNSSGNRDVDKEAVVVAAAAALQVGASYPRHPFQKEGQSVTGNEPVAAAAVRQQCLFDSGTESGGISAIDDEDNEEDGENVGNDEENTLVVLEEVEANDNKGETEEEQLFNWELAPVGSSSQYDDRTSGSTNNTAEAKETGAELSWFMQGLKDSLKRKANKDNKANYGETGGGEGNGGKSDISGVPSVSSSVVGFAKIGERPPSNINNAGSEFVGSFGDKIPGTGNSVENAAATAEVEITKVGDSGLIQQVDTVLTLLRDSLLKDPTSCLAQIPGLGNSSGEQNFSALSSSSTEGSSKEKELIALIDRLKSSLSLEKQQQNQQQQQIDADKKNSSANPTDHLSASDPPQKNVTGHLIPEKNTNQNSMLGCATAPRPNPAYYNPNHDISPFPPSRSSSNPWVTDFSASSERINSTCSNLSLLSTSTEQLANNPVDHINASFDPSSGVMAVGRNNMSTETPVASNGDGSGVPWKIRLAKRRSQPRSHTVGVTQEELAEARRLFEEATGFRLEHQTHPVAPTPVYSVKSQQPQPQQQIYQQKSYSPYENVSDLVGSGVVNNNKYEVEDADDDEDEEDDDSVFLRSGDASLVGRVPAYANPISPCCAPTQSHAAAQQQANANIPLSPTSSLSTAPFASSSAEDVGLPARSIIGTSTNAPDNRNQALESLPKSGGVGSGGAITPVSSAPSNWQTDVEKRLTSVPRPFVPFVKNATQYYEGYQPPPERRMTYASIDDSVQMPGGVLGNLKIKPFRTYSLDSNKPSGGGHGDDPSKSLFTPQETVQIAIHQAAIKKQMSEEEDRRKRRNSLTFNQQQSAGAQVSNATGSGGGSPGVKQDILLPKPYSPPKLNQDVPSSPVKSPSSGYLSNPLLFQSTGADSGYTEPESGIEESTQKEDNKMPIHHQQNKYDSLSDSVSGNGSSMAVVPFSSSSVGGNAIVNVNATSNGLNGGGSVTSSGNTITYTTTPTGGFVQQQQSQNSQQQQSPQRIENVQISLKDISINSSEFPQLQIAITLNTNNGPSSSSSSNETSGKGNNSAVMVDGGGSVPANVTRIPSTTTTGTTVTTNLQLGGVGVASGGYGHRAMGQDGSGSQQQCFSNDEGQQQQSASLSRAIRYKSKTERKKRMKRANTIDIPHPPGLLLQQNNEDDDTTGMEDEEDSDSNNYGGRMLKNVSAGGSSGIGGGGQQGKYPFLPKTEGDRKFLAFLEKNNALTEQQGRPGRPTGHLGVTQDRQWLNRFSNLKTSFESSSQGSSPSASPIPSNMRGTRYVSELALSQERRGGGATSADSFNKPVWANTDKSQLPPQVRNKLHMFEGPQQPQQPEYYPPWRSPPPSQQLQQQQQQHGWQSSSHQHHHHPQGNQFISMGGMGPGMKQTVSTSALNQVRGGPVSSQSSRGGYNRPAYSSHDNMALVGQKKIQFQGSSFDSKLKEQSLQQPMRRPTPVKLQSGGPTPTAKSVTRDVGGVHMVHATAAAMEAMKKSAFVPATTVPATSSAQHHHQTTTMAGFPQSKQIHDDRIDLPWAKRANDSPVQTTTSTKPSSSSISSKDASRVQSSKARFEQPGSSTPSQLAQSQQQHPPSLSSSSASTATTQQQYRQSAKALSLDNSSNLSSFGYPGGQQQTNSSSVTTNAKPNQQLSSVVSVSGVGSQPPPQQQQNQKFSNQQHLQQQQSMGGSTDEFVPVVRPSLKSFGVTQSFDEAFKRKLDQQVASGATTYSDDSDNNNGPTPITTQKYEDATRATSGGQQQQLVNNSITSTKMSPFEPSSDSAFTRPLQSSGGNGGGGDEGLAPVVGADGLILTPVVAKVMRGPQQQRATFQNRMSSLQDDQQNTRLTGARSNLRNFLNQHQQQQQSSVPAMGAGSSENSKQDDNSPTNSPKLSSGSLTGGGLLNLPPLTKSLSGDAILSSNHLQNSIITKPALPSSSTGREDAAEVRRLQQQQPRQPRAASPPTTQISSIISSNSNRPRNELPCSALPHQERPTLIPRQKSLSEFHKGAGVTCPPQKIEPLSIETDIQRLLKSQQQQSQVQVQQQRPAGGHHQRNQPSIIVPQQQSKVPVSQQPVVTSSGGVTGGRTNSTNRSYPESLHRTSSGSSIFSRAKNLFFGSQDSQQPPSTKLRPKLPTQPSTSPQGGAKLTFPKQFEAQMSPDSADRKQRELATYFKQQQQELLRNSAQGSSGGGVKTGGKLRKSASHSKIMHRQRSLSDGDEDVDAIFESLFKASGTPK